MTNILVVVLLFMPWLLILWLADYADRQRERGLLDSGRVLAGTTYVVLVLFYLGFFSFGLLAQATSVLARDAVSPELSSLYRSLGMDAATFMRILSAVGVGLWLPSLLGVLLLLRPVRRLFARLIPIDPERTVHAVALSFTMLVLINLLVTLGVGLRNLAAMMEAGQQAGGATASTTPEVWAQQILMALMGLVGVGWLSRRPLGAALQRLAIVRPSGRQALAGLGIGLLLVPAVLGVEALGKQFGIGTDADVERLTEQLLGQLTQSIPGILTLGLAAALGEETLFRGALLPRFGALLTAILFGLLHSNYGITLSTAFVFVIGLVLGAVRLRFNTSTAMIVHAVYNMSLGLITYLGLFSSS